MRNFIQPTKIGVLILFVLLYNLTFGQNHRKLTNDSEKAFQSQQFDEAVFLAINALMIDPSFVKAIESLQKSLPASIRSNENKISQLKESSTKFRGDITVDECQEIVNRYNTLVQINENLLNLPEIKPKKGDPVKFEIKNFYNELIDAKEVLMQNKELAAEQHYQTGHNLLKKGDLENSKAAAKAFKRALSFVPDFKDASLMYEQARKLGIKRIAIIPFENKSGKSQYGAISEMITDQIVSELLKNALAMEFVEIISRDQLQQVVHEQNLGSSGIISESTAIQVGKVLGVHELIVGQINQITSTETPTTNKEYMNERKIYSKQGDYMIYAKVTEFEKKASATISGSYKIIDAQTAKINKSDTFREEYNFISQWALYSGDEKALNNHSDNLCRQREQNAPIDEERVNIVSRKLASALVNTIVRYVQ